MRFPKSTIDLDLELKALSYLISDSTNFFDLQSADFSHATHRKVFDEIKNGAIATTSQLVNSGLSDLAIQYIYSDGVVYSSVEMEKIAKILRTMTYARKKYYDAQVLCQKIAGSSPSELSNVVGDITLREHTFTPDKLSEMLKTAELPKEITFEPASINEIFRFFSPGWVSFIAASTGVGKTSTAIQISRSIAEFEGSYSLYISLEMPLISYLERATSIKFYQENPDYEYRDWLQYRKTLTASELDRHGKCGNEIIVDKPGLSISEIKEQAKKLINCGFNVKTIVIDHIYILRSENGNKTENESQASIASDLDKLAKELDVRVLAVCQTRKGDDDDRFKEPHLGDIRGSKALSEIAWWVLMLWRSKDNKNIINWKCAKQRYGEGVGHTDTIQIRGTYMYDSPQMFYNQSY